MFGYTIGEWVVGIWLLFAACTAVYWTVKFIYDLGYQKAEREERDRWREEMRRQA
jgi:hypothetical protein